MIRLVWALPLQLTKSLLLTTLLRFGRQLIWQWKNRFKWMKCRYRRLWRHWIEFWGEEARIDTTINDDVISLMWTRHCKYFNSSLPLVTCLTCPLNLANVFFRWHLLLILFFYCRDAGLEGVDGWTHSRALQSSSTSSLPTTTTLNGSAATAAALAKPPVATKKGPRGARTKRVDPEVLRSVHLPLQTNLTRWSSKRRTIRPLLSPAAASSPFWIQ